MIMSELQGMQKEAVRSCYEELSLQ